MPVSGLSDFSASAFAITARPGAAGLSDAEQSQLRELRQRDQEVRSHERAHLTAAGGLAVSGATYSFQRGPDGVYYAVGGEVRIDTSPGRTPEETLRRAQIIRAAALAPSDPSSADRAAAAQAQRLEQQARIELTRQQEAPGDSPSVSAYSAASGGPRPTPILDVFA